MMRWHLKFPDGLFQRAAGFLVWLSRLSRLSRIFLALRDRARRAPFFQGELDLEPSSLRVS